MTARQPVLELVGTMSEEEAEGLLVQLKEDHIDYDPLTPEEEAQLAESAKALQAGDTISAEDLFKSAYDLSDRVRRSRRTIAQPTRCAYEKPHSRGNPCARGRTLRGQYQSPSWETRTQPSRRARRVLYTVDRTDAVITVTVIAPRGQAYRDR